MEEKKSFFELLDPKSALLVGLVGGFLALGTVGFIVLGVTVARSGKNTSPATVAQVGDVQGGGQQAANTPPPTVPKSDKPKVELFVMSYCPFGLQMEKAYVPAWNLLKNVADIDVKFVSYAMHGKKEIDENTRQYCIQSEQPQVYQKYLSCFFGAGANNGAEANYKGCLASAGVNQSKLSSCVSKTDSQYRITAQFNDQSTWLSGQYPVFPIHEDLNQKYGVQGSPTLVINGVQADVARTPEAVKQAICNAFNNPPAECNQTLPNTGYQAGFGLATADTAGASASPGCGV